MNQTVDYIEKYEGIALNFGKHKGKTLKMISHEEKGGDYLIWLHGEMVNKESLTPTQKAIMRYISAVYNVERKK